MKKRAAGYIRVSTMEQTKNESLEVQIKAIKEYAQIQGHDVVKIYRDEGISGATVDERHDLQKCLKDATVGKYDILIVNDLSRFGRNVHEILENYELLKEADVILISLKENIDFTSAYGKAMYTLFGVMAELERTIIKERMLGGKLSKALKGIPTTGKPPFGRTFNKETGEWEVDPDKKRVIQSVAKEFISGESLRRLAEVMTKGHLMPISYDGLRNILKYRCGDKYTLQFEGQEPIVYDVPPLLDNDTIKQVRDTLEFNRVNNRNDVKDKYLY